MANQGKVSIVVLNWNGRDDTVECLESLRAVDYPDHEIVVVDNGSTDDSVEAIRRRFPEVKIVEIGDNLGYTGGNNAGIRCALAAGAEFVLLLNNDTKVCAKLVSQLVSAAVEHPNAGFFSPKIYFYSEPTRIWFAGGKWSERKAQFIHLGYGMDDSAGAFNAVTVMDYACGCAVLVRTSVIRQIGLLDERFFLVFEDVDWCYRGRKAGFESLFVPDAAVWHKASRSFGGSESPLITYFHTRNRLLWGAKHLPLLGFIALLRRVCVELLPDFRWPAFPSAHGLRASHAKRLYWNALQWCADLRRQWRRARTELTSAHARARFLGIRDFALARFGGLRASKLQRSN